MERLARRGRIERLREALHYSETFSDEQGREWDAGAHVRVQAIQALAQFEPTVVVGDLLAALDDRAAQVRLAAVEALGAQPTRVAGVLERLLDLIVARRPGNEEVASRALDVVVQWRAYGAAQLLVDRLLDPGSPELDETHREAFEYVLQSDGGGPAATQVVTDRLLDRLAQERPGPAEGRALEVLRWLGPAALDRLLGALAHDGASPGMMRAAGMTGDSRAIEPIVRGLRREDPAMRAAAADAARALNHTRAVPALLAATQDDDQTVRDAASAALDRMGTAAVIAGLAVVVNARGLGPGGIASLQQVPLEELDGAHIAQALAAPVEEDAEEEKSAAIEAEPAGADGPATGPVTDAMTVNGAAAAPRSAPPPKYPDGRRRGGLLDRLLGPRDY